MIPVDLQDFLVEELKRLFDGQTMKNPDGEQSPFFIYPQNLPAKTATKPEMSKLFPHIRVILVNGSDPDEESPNTCKILIQVGTYDDSLDYQGYRDVCHVLQTIYDHLTRTRYFDNQYEVSYPFDWALHEEKTAPLWFGAMETNWLVGKITQKDDQFC